MVSIVVVTYNKLDLLKRCVENVRDDKVSLEYELIIVDNGSTDDVGSYIERVIKPDIFVSLDHNWGYGGGYSLGCCKTSGNYICLLENDVLITDGTIEKLKEALERNPDVGIVCPYIIEDDPSRLDELAHVQATSQEELLDNQMSASCMMLSREIYELLIRKDGILFDKRFKIATSEDWDLYTRIHLFGKRTCTVSQSVAFHGSMQTRKDIPGDYVSINKQRFVEKWGFTGPLRYDNQEGTVLVEGVPRKKTLVVVPVYNNLHLTVACLGFLRRNTYWPMEVLVVNNGSTDGTKEWLDGFLGENSDWFSVHHNDENWGVSKSWNFGIEVAEKRPDIDYLVFLNNDTEVSEGWLYNLHWVMCLNPMIKVVSAEHVDRVYTSDRVADPGVYIFEKGSFLPPGYCFLVPKDIFSTVGGFDEGFKLCNYEESDFFRRLQQKDYLIALSGRAYVKHYAMQTTKLFDIQKIMEENRALYESRWGA